ncbi:hypothetical protein BD410DRAFT_782581 [Rickenella mellea]|uniref:DUF4211 domain-containing protein n=1 Tax=Rickenella mellea TaxID=50990 RepID=A0A4Y7QIN8_9AGAM|nr:hypothetical protein BD410DRAFT_782581 [Rickenella mellea]
MPPATCESRQKTRQKSLLGYVVDLRTPTGESPVGNRCETISVDKRSTNSKDNLDSSDVDQTYYGPKPLRDAEESDVESEGAKQSLHLVKERKIRRRRVVQSDSDSERVTPSEAEAPEISSRLSRVRKAGRKRVIDSEDEDVSRADKPSPVKNRKIRKGRKTPSHKNSDGSNDDDDDFGSVDKDNIILSRHRQPSNRVTAFEKSLQRLQTRKTGVRKQSSDDEDSSDASLRKMDIIPGAKCDYNEGNLDRRSESDSEDGGFIVEDGPDTNSPELPAAFSMSTHQDMSHHFKIVCQLMLHLATSPPECRKDSVIQLTQLEYFLVPLQITRRKVSGIRDSIASSVWTPDFIRALKMFPEFSLTSLDFAIPHCDACNLGGRLSTIIGRLDGLPYDPLTYESSDDPSKLRNRVDREFNLGRFCAKRTFIFHQLSHWEHLLYSSLSEEINSVQASEDPRAFVHVAFAGGIKPPKDKTDADKMMEWLDQRGVVQNEWSKLKDLLTRAINLDTGNGKDDDSY